MFQTGGLLVLPFLSFWDFPGDFPDLRGDGPGIFPIGPFPLSQPIKSTYEEQSRKGPRHNLDHSRKKSGKHPGLETPRFSFSQSSPKKAHKHKEMGPQNWTLDPTPKTPLDPPPPRNSLCTVFCWENQHLHKEFGRLSPLLDPPARVPPKFFMQIFFGCFFRS